MTGAGVPTPPGVAADDPSVEYWRALAERRIRLEQCGACGRHRVVPMPSCPWCGDPATTIVDAVGTGHVYSWITVHRAFDDRHAGDVPYTVAAVELTESCRVFARLEADPDAVTIGLALAARYVAHDGWTELRFAPAESAR